MSVCKGGLLVYFNNNMSMCCTTILSLVSTSIQGLAGTQDTEYQTRKGREEWKAMPNVGDSKISTASGTESLWIDTVQSLNAKCVGLVNS
jgi:hypothetical protein